MFSVNMLSVVMLSVVMLSVVMLNVVMLSVVMLSVIMFSVIMLSVVMLIVFMLNVFMLNVFMLNVLMLNIFMLNVFMLRVIIVQKTTCQLQIKFITDNYLQMHVKLQLFTSTFTYNTNKFTSFKVIKNTNVQTQSYKNAKLIKAWIILKLFTVLGLMK